MPSEQNKPTRAIKLEAADGEELPTGRSWFFGIGINRYRHFSPLHNAVGDVQALQAVLHKKYGIDQSITLFDEQATRRNIFQQLKQFEQEIGEHDKLLLLFSGHGHLGTGGGHWVPYEAEPGFDDDYLPNFHLKVYLRNIKARHILVISDSCFSGSLFAEGVSRRHAGPEERLEQLPSRYGFCSGRHDEEVWDGPAGTHSPFAGSILEILEENRDPMLRASVFADAVLNRTVVQYRQLPRHGPLFDVGDKGGQYIFRLKTGQAATNSFTDPRDGRSYCTVKLNGLHWMAENLNYDVGEGCWIYNNDIENSKKYGRLYSWSAAAKACPPGWRVPTDEEWKNLLRSFGGYYEAEAKQQFGKPEKAYEALMEGGSSGFAAKLGGSHYFSGIFGYLGRGGSYWSATQENEVFAWYYDFVRQQGRVERSLSHKSVGRGLRCVRV